MTNSGSKRKPCQPVVAGERFGRLVAVRLVSSTGPAKWDVLCDCGASKTIAARSLRKGSSRSCGCLQRELMAARNATHGRTYTSMYTLWGSMFNRCCRPTHESYPAYGGRGIKICERWKSFENFLADMGERPTPQHSLDRIDVDGDYEPGNVRWATQKEQCRNKRTNRLIEIDGVSRCVSEWCEIFGTPVRRAFGRLQTGWNPIDAVRMAKQPSLRRHYGPR
jgi:hypothetical protein